MFGYSSRAPPWRSRPPRQAWRSPNWCSTSHRSTRTTATLYVPGQGLAGRLAELVSAGRRGDAVELYQTHRRSASPKTWPRKCGTRPSARPRGDRPHARLRCDDRRRPVAANRPDRLDHSAGTGDQRRTEPAIPARRGASRRAGAAQRAAEQPPRPKPTSARKPPHRSWRSSSPAAGDGTRSTGCSGGPPRQPGHEQLDMDHHCMNCIAPRSARSGGSTRGPLIMDRPVRSVST